MAPAGRAQSEDFEALPSLGVDCLEAALGSTGGRTCEELQLLKSLKAPELPWLSLSCTL